MSLAVITFAYYVAFAVAPEEIPPQGIGDLLPAVALQLPLVAVVIFAVFKDWLRSGPRVDRERTFLVDLWREEQQARRALEDKLDVLAGTLKEATDVVERSVELNERIVNDFVRPVGTRTRSADRRD